MSAPPGTRPLAGRASLFCCFVAMAVLPAVGYFVTRDQIGRLPNDGQNYGVVILAALGVFVTAAAMGVVAVVGAVTAGVGLLRRERPRRVAVGGLVGNLVLAGGLAAVFVALWYVVG